MHANWGSRFVFALALCLAIPFEALATISTTGSVSPNPATTTQGTTLYIGQSGNGTMLANAGSDVLSGNSYIAYIPGSNSTATIDGAGSTWTNGGFLYVGNFGTGALNVTSGGVVTAHTTYVGSEVGSSGNISIDGAGSILTMSADMQVGYRGNGTISITNGGQLKNTGSNGSNIGFQNSTTGSVTIDGAGSKWINNSGLSVGASGTGSLAIKNGGFANSGSTTVGFQSTVTVDGPGSIWNPIGFSVGSAAGSSVKITNGAQLNAPGGIGLGANVNSPLTITDSQATTGRLSLPANSNGYDITLTNSTFATTDLVGHLEEIGGVATFGAHGLVTNGDLVFDQANGLQRQVIINGDPGQNITINFDFNSSGILGAGYDAAGTLTIAGGRTVPSSYGYLGFGANGTGTGTVDGAGTNWNITNELDVGVFGQGSLNLTGGARISANRAKIGTTAGLSHTGAMVVSGIGTTWNNTLDLTVSQGSLQILSGAHVTDRNSSIGNYSGAATATVTVDGAGSTWTNSGELRIGDGSSGSLAVTHGAVVTSGSGYVSAFAAYGTATIDGPGSTWTCNGDLTIGKWGYNGTLQITNGAHVSSREGELGQSTSGNIGNVTVDGSGSAWTMTDELTLNFSSNLRIQNGAQVSAALDTTIESSIYGTAHIIFDHGTLTTQALYAGADELQGTGDVYARGLVTDGDVVLSKVVGAWQPFQVTGQNSHDLTFHLTSNSLTTIGAGYKSTGSLTIASGLAVNASGAEFGHFAGSNGVFHLTGPGTSLTLSGFFTAGSSGAATVEITAGAAISDYQATIGSGAGSSGNALVSGNGSQWTNSSSITVGSNGNGTLNINSGGSVWTPRAYIGYYSGVTGSANIDGAGSIFSISQDLVVGNSGTGTLGVSGGLVDLAGNLTLGSASGGKGTLNLSGGTLRMYGGTLAKGSGTAIINLTGGRLECVGTINLGAAFVQSGVTLAPGTSVAAGTTNVTGGYTLDSGKLEINLFSSTQRDVLAVTGQVNLFGANSIADGVLSVVLDFAPTIGSMYLILTNDSNDAIVGTFANGSSVKAAYNNRLYTFGINYAASVGANDIVLTTQSAGGILGDYNSDGAVDASDVVTWRKTFNATGLPYFGADGNGDGIVNDADYQVWRANFGRTPSGAGASVNAAIPEPPTVALLMLAVVSFAIQMRRPA